MDPLPRILLAAWVVILGAVVGSFLNVVIARLPAGESLVRPRSRCPGCKAPIAWYDNVPIVSFLLLRGRCRACRRPISWRYPTVEALTAGVAFLAFARHGLGVAAFAELVFASLVIALAFIDLDTWLLPHGLTFPLIATGLLASAFRVTPAGGFAPALIGASAGGGAFFLVAFVGERVFRKEALGLGDVWLLAGIGAWLGHLALLPVVLFASLQGAVVGIVQLAMGRGERGPPEPSREGEGPATAASPADPTEQHAVGAPPDAVPVPATPAETRPGEGEEPWIPPRHAIPFGPFIAAAAFEWLYLAPQLARAFPILRPFV